MGRPRTEVRDPRSEIRGRRTGYPQWNSSTFHGAMEAGKTENRGPRTEVREPRIRGWEADPSGIVPLSTGRWRSAE